MFSGEQNLSLMELSKHLDDLVKEEKVFDVEGFYLLKNEPQLIARRKKGNLKAEELMKKAHKNASFISSFPFVKGVYVSGSLSKGYIDGDGDIDFFIVTKPNRLWIARTFLILYKKVFLLNSKKYFCVNYFIDDEQLEIKDKNIFTATEITTLLPMVNEQIYAQFLEANEWVKEYYPHFSKRDTSTTNQRKKTWLGQSLEKILSGSFGDRLDAAFMKRTLKRWQNKFHHLSDEEMELLMRTNRRVSKHHPSDFQTKVLNRYQEKLDQYGV